MNKESTIRFYTAHIAIIVLVAFVGIVYQSNRIHDIRTERDAYKDKLLQKQVKYEDLRDTVAKLERDLADRNARLAAAAKREKQAHFVRASRSRMADVSQTKPQNTSNSVSAGKLYDITMYCPTGSRTASGKWPSRGMVATISRSIPFGTRVRIEGLGTFRVEDRIGSGSEFDIFTPSCEEAEIFGRQHRRVTILS